MSERRTIFADLASALDAPPEDVRDLRLRVTNNRFRKKELPELARFPDLRALDVSGHDFTSLPRLSSPAKIVRLTVSSQRRLTSLEGIEAFTSLEELDLHDCGALEWPDTAKRLAMLPALTRLRIGGRGIPRLPAGFEELQGLLELTVIDSDYDFADALPRFATLSGLRLLRISVRPLPAIPDAFGGFRELRELDLAWNLRAIPPSIGGIASLETLHVRGTELGAFPAELCRLQRLRALHLDYAVLESLPEEIGELAALEEIGLSAARRLKALPGTIGRLSKLRFLDIGFSGVKQLPDSIVDLAGLRVLRAWQLKKLPKGFERLSFDECHVNEKLRARVRLLPPKTELVDDLRIDRDGPALPEDLGDPRTLTIWMPSLREPPVAFSKLRRLEELTIYAGEIDVEEVLSRLAEAKSLRKLELQLRHGFGLPAAIGRLESLESLGLGQCPRVGALPREIGRLRRLKTLMLGQNALSSLPDEIGELQALQSLWIGETMVSALPESFGKLGSLERIDLLSVPIARLPASFSALSSLREARFWNTRFEAPPPELRDLGALESLTIGRNTPTLDVDALFRLLAGKPLQYLGLRSNEIRVLPPSVGDLAVETLDLVYNPLTAVPPEIGRIATLKRISVGRYQPGGFKDLLPKGRWRKEERSGELTYVRTA